MSSHSPLLPWQEESVLGLLQRRANGLWGAAQLGDSRDSEHQLELNGRGQVLSQDTEALWALGQVGASPRQTWW